MCGIGALSRATPSSIPDAALSLRLMALGLLERGPDATGFAWVTRNDPWPYSWKDDVEATEAAWAAPLPTQIQTALVHTRFATQGSPTVHENNHPISLPGLVLVHNGIVTNDDEIFDDLNAERVGEVDSEAIAALLAYGPDAFGEEDPAALLELVEGDAACAWITTYEPDVLNLVRLRSRPLVLAWTRKGDLYAASTSSAIRIASCGVEFVKFEDVPEGTYLQVRGGEVIHKADVKLPERTYSWQKGYQTSASGSTTYSYMAGKHTYTSTTDATGKTTIKPVNTTASTPTAKADEVSDAVQATVKSIGAERKARKRVRMTERDLTPVREFVSVHASSVDTLEDPFDEQWGE